MEWIDFSNYENPASKFTAQLSEKGGYITFSNSGKGGDQKFFTLSLESFASCLKDILDNIEPFSEHEDYSEKAWRDLGARYFSDRIANSQITVQTKAMFATLSKIIMWGNSPDLNSINPESKISLDPNHIRNSLSKLNDLAELFAPSSELFQHQEQVENRAENDSLFDIIAYVTDLSKSGLLYSNTTVHRFVASLMTKPFVLLTGLSGSGKTKLAQSFVTWICEAEDQYRIIPVGADWTNREPLLGYPNGLDAKEYILPDCGALTTMIEAGKAENQHKPYFLILDEMNLSHVERYFADFLSVMESDDRIMLYSGSERMANGDEVPRHISWPRNLFVIGTVNIDETTYMFSPKVLDRANTIEFRISNREIQKFLSSPAKTDLSLLKGKGAPMAESFLDMAQDKSIAEDEFYTETFVRFFDELRKIGAEFGYRTAVEMLLLIQKLNQLGTADHHACLDIAVMQKLLPKLHGSRSKISKVLDALIGLCLNEGQTFSISKSDELNAEETRYPLAFEKLVRMYRNALDNGFTSYAEA